MEVELLQNPAADGSKSNSKSRRKMKRRGKKKAMEKNGPQILDNSDGKLKVSGEITDSVLVDNDLQKNLLDTDLAGQCPKMAAGSTNNLAEVSPDGEMKIRRKKIKKKAKVKIEAQSIDGSKMDIESTENLPEGKVNEQRKRRRKRIKKKEKSKDEVQNMNQVDEMLNLHLSDGDHERGIDGKVTENQITVQESEVSLEKESSLSDLVKDKENTSDLGKKEEICNIPDVVEVSCTRVSSELPEEMSQNFLRPMEVEETDNMPDAKFENGLDELNTETIVYEGKCLAEGRDVLSTCDAELSTHVTYPCVNESECLFKYCGQYPQILPISSSKRKLLVLDVNGLLANIVFPAPKDCKGDTHILGRAVFKRPFCDDFLKFCFQNFDVGIWSSRSKKLIDRVVEYLLGDLQDQIMFCWDMDHSTQTGFKTLENCHKPLVCKELRKIWESDDPNLPWKKGQYNESNTLLLDDSPYKALLNPLHTAIFPNSYHYEDKNDNSLGPGGDLRVYLEGLLTSENVRKYVEQHPFGQGAINESSLSWGFYSGVLQTMSIRLEDNTHSSLPALS